MGIEIQKIERELDCKKGAATLLFDLDPLRLDVTLMSTDDPSQPMRGTKGEVDEESCRFVLGLLKDLLRRPHFPFQLQIPVVAGFRVFPARNGVPARSTYASDIKHIELLLMSKSDATFLRETLTQLMETLRNRRLASRLHRT